MRPTPRSRRPAPSPDPAQMAEALLTWFPGAARDLPWRRTTDPYAVWISEIMLQQTQVKTVIPYWERWMRELPTVKALAEAAEERVLKLWEGLGYYSRARNLQRAAREILAQPGGGFPQTAEALLELPGIGPYTAGAIASIAFNQRAPILDGNLIRVFCRYHGWAGDPTAQPLKARLWAWAGAVVAAADGLPPSSTPGPAACRWTGNCSRVNQAMMELGATVCRVGEPDCPSCPLQTSCRAAASGNPSQFPELRRRPTVVARRFATVLWTDGQSWWMRQRGADEHNGGFWEFPQLELSTEADPSTALARWMGVPAVRFRPAGRRRHSITRYRITEEIFLLEWPRTALVAGREAGWFTARQVHALPVTGAHRRLATEHVDNPQD